MVKSDVDTLEVGQYVKYFGTPARIVWLDKVRGRVKLSKSQFQVTDWISVSKIEPRDG